MIDCPICRYALEQRAEAVRDRDRDDHEGGPDELAQILLAWHEAGHPEMPLPDPPDEA